MFTDLHHEALSAPSFDPFDVPELCKKREITVEDLHVGGTHKCIFILKYEGSGGEKGVTAVFSSNGGEMPSPGNRNFPSHRVQEVWTQMVQKGVKGEYLRDILMFYLQHNLFPPLDQQSYNALLLTFSAKGVNKKMKNILEEISLYLQNSIAETVRFSSNTFATAELLSVIQVGGLLPLLDVSTVDKLVRLLEDNDLWHGEKGKVLFFLCQAAGLFPDLISMDHVVRLNRLLSSWLWTPLTPMSTGSQLFGRFESAATEVDGSPAADIFTVLTIEMATFPFLRAKRVSPLRRLPSTCHLNEESVNIFNNSQMMNVHTFSVIKEWLNNVPESSSDQTVEHALLLDAVKEYCNIVVEQCFRKAQKEDVGLQKAVMCEVLNIIHRVVQLDRSRASKTLILVKRIYTHISDRFKSDNRDISILVRVFRFLLEFGDSTGYTPQHLYELFLGDTLYRCYSSGLAAWDIAVFLCEQHNKLELLLSRFFPNILKLVACHPAALVEEFLHLLPAMISSANAMELFSSLLDLPLLSATLLLHQAPAVVQLDVASPLWSRLLESVSNPAHQLHYTYLLRKESGKMDTPGRHNIQPSGSKGGTHISPVINCRFSSYLEVLADLRVHPLVMTCSEVTPLLIDVFLSAVEHQGNPHSLAEVLITMLRKVNKLYNVDGYPAAVYKILSKHLRQIVQLCPEGLLTNENEVSTYLSILDNCDTALDFYTHLVWAVGELASSTKSAHCNNYDVMTRLYETVESALYEILGQLSSKCVSLKLINIIAATLAKLASRCEDLIPRVMLCFHKVSTGISNTGLPTVDKQIVQSRVDELACILRNPTIAASVLTSSREEDPALSAVFASSSDDDGFTVVSHRKNNSANSNVCEDTVVHCSRARKLRTGNKTATDLQTVNKA
uniref:Uncharacterized protein n=1 Tax=Timema cristinae TaxID=61476 RepID=A0A7R9D994_TIMCR|nr:unnamed protein product [Timema cristinae]